MNTVLPELTPFLNWVMNLSLPASLLILLVLAVSWIARKRLSPRWRYALWFLVMLRLLIPFSFTPHFSTSQFEKLGERVQNTLKISPGITTPASGASIAGAVPINTANTKAIFTPSVEKGLVMERLWNGVKNLFPIVWIAGVLLLLLRVGWEHWRFSSRIVRQHPTTDTQLLNLLQAAKEELRVHTPVALIITPQVKTPMLLGFIRPRLVLPEAILASFCAEEIRYVFLHELGHLKRHDILINWLTTILQIVHWFNPLVWIAFRQMRADREQACDALVLSYARENEKIPYGETILKLLQHFSRPATLPSLVGILEDKDQMRARIRLIGNFDKGAKRHSLLGGVLLLLLILIGFTQFRDAKAAQNPNHATQLPYDGTWNFTFQGFVISVPNDIAAQISIDYDLNQKAPEAFAALQQLVEQNKATATALPSLTTKSGMRAEAINTDSKLDIQPTYGATGQVDVMVSLTTNITSAHPAQIQTELIVEKNGDVQSLGSFPDPTDATKTEFVFLIPAYTQIPPLHP
ncbi:MAG: M56 family metallopeptidase [Chthoniobacterales bacterium]